MIFNTGDKVVLTHDVGDGEYGCKGDTGTIEKLYGDHALVRLDAERSGDFKWYISFSEMRTVVKPTLADELTLKPSTKRVLTHMRRSGSITVLEALAAYGTARIAPAIHDLRKIGFDIETVSKKDAAGHEYTRYVLNEPKRSKAA